MTIGSTDDGYDARGKGPAEIERDIAATRADLGAVIDALEARLAPRHLVEKGMEMMKDSLEGEGGLGATLRAHPVPVALVGAGLGWLLIAATGGPGLARRAEEAAPDTPAYQAGEELAGYAYARTKPRLPAAADAAADAADAAAGGVRRGLRRAIEDYPLALALAGLFAGVALGFLLPKAAERAIEATGG